MLFNLLPPLLGAGFSERIDILGLALPFAGVFLIISIASMAVGEMMASPRIYEYLGAIAPKGEEGLYLGYANLPIALASIFGGPLGGALFEKFIGTPMKEGRPTNSLAMWAHHRRNRDRIHDRPRDLRPDARQKPRRGYHPRLLALSSAILPSIPMTIFFTSMETPDASTARWTIRKRPEQQGTVMMATVRDLELVSLDDFSDLLDIAFCFVELRTGDDQLFPLEQVLVKAPQGKGRAVGRDEQVAPLEIGRERRDQMELDRPLAEPGLCPSPGTSGLSLVRFGRNRAGGASRAPGKAEGMGAGTVNAGCRLLPPRLEDMGERRLGVVPVAFPLDDLERARRADVQAGAHPVTVKLPDQDRLVLGVQGEGSLGAGRGAQPAAVALITLDLYDFSFGHESLPPLF